MEKSYKSIRENLAIEILDKIKSCSPWFFERLVVELLVKMWYWWSIQDAWQSWDWWIDWIIKEDKLWLDIIYIQAKRREGVVWSPELMKFGWALSWKKANKWVFITTSHFTKDAVEYTNSTHQKIILIDWERLVNLMMDCNLWVSIANIYEIKRIDNDYFEEI